MNDWEDVYEDDGYGDVLIEDIADDDDIEAVLAEYDDEGEDAAERRRRRRSRRRKQRPRTGRGTGYYQPKTERGYVTQTQLKAGLSRVSKDVKSNAAGIKKNYASLGSLGVRLDRAIAGQKKQSEQNSMMMLLPLMMQPKYLVSEPIAAATQGMPVGSRYVYSSDAGGTDDTMMMMVMMMMMSGGGKGDMMSNPVMLLLLLEAMK